MPRLNGYFIRLAQGLILVMLTSCTSLSYAPDTTSVSPKTATNTLGPQGSAPYTPDEPTLTRIVPGNRQCEGAAGAVIHPLARDQCVLNAMLLPITSAINVVNALPGAKKDVGIYHTDLPNIQNFYVPQIYQNDCWAAAFEMTRKYLKLYPVSQQELVAHAYRICPTLSSQRYGATLYQIYYTMNDELEKHDASSIFPHFCDESKCIVFSLLSGQPVIVLMSDHAVVMVGADWEKLSDNFALILRARVLDPAKGNEIQTLSGLQLCNADAFISY